MMTEECDGDEICGACSDDDLHFSDNDAPEKVTMEKTWAKDKVRLEYNTRVANGTEPLKSWTPEWIESRERMKRMFAGKWVASDDLLNKMRIDIPTQEPVVAEDIEEKSEADDDPTNPWLVKMTKSKAKKLSGNQRRAAARRPVGTQADPMPHRCGRPMPHQVLRIYKGCNAGIMLCPSNPVSRNVGRLGNASGVLARS